MNELVNAAGLERVEHLDDANGLARAGLESVRLDLAGAIVEVRFDCPDAAQLYRRRYRHMLSDGRPGRIAYAVAQKPDEHFFWVEGGSAYRWRGSPLKPHAVAFFTDAVVGTTVFRSLENVVTLHAAAISDGFSAAAIIGSTTAGKTTTAIACARRGLALYSDEFCIVAPNGILPFPRSLSLRCAATEVLANDPVPSSAVDAWLRTHGCCDGYDLGYDELFGTLERPAPRPLRTAFVLIGKGAQPSIREVSRVAMVAHAGPWAKLKASGFEAFETLLALFEGVACYEVVLGSPDATARAIRRTMERVPRVDAA